MKFEVTHSRKLRQGMCITHIMVPEWISRKPHKVVTAEVAMYYMETQRYKFVVRDGTDEVEVQIGRTRRGKEFLTTSDLEQNNLLWLLPDC